MTRAEYLEYVQESLAFPTAVVCDNPACGCQTGAVLTRTEHLGVFSADPEMQLRDTPEVCKQLERVHQLYCFEVEKILFPERREEVKKEMTGRVQLWQVEDRLNGGNVGHGHVTPRPDGVRARCGGPGICPVCSQEDSRRRDAMG